MPNSTVLLIDVGTSAIKAQLIEEATGRISHDVRFPAIPAWSVGHFCAAMRPVFNLIQKTSASRVVVTALLGFVVTDTTGSVLDVFPWNDSRGREQADLLRRECADLELICGRDAKWLGAAKALWVRAHTKSLGPITLLSIKDWINFVATRRLVTDPIFAAYMGIWDVLHNAPFIEGVAVLERFNIIVPTVLPLGQPIARLERGQELLNGTVDGVTGALSFGELEPGMVTVVTGTTDVCFVVTDQYAPASGCVNNPLSGRFLVGGGMAAIGRFVSWLFQCNSPVPDDVSMARHSVLCLPYIAGARVPWNDGLSGGFFGITESTDRVTLYLSLLEASAFEIRHLCEVVKGVGEDLTAIYMGGGAATKVRARILSSVTGKPVVLDPVADTNHGALTLAGISTLRRSEQMVFHPDQRFSPYFDHKYGQFLALRSKLSSVE